MSKLKPCPFCGEMPKVEFDEYYKKHWIYCNNPKCRIQPNTAFHKRKSVIVREWNRRKEGEQK